MPKHVNFVRFNTVTVLVSVSEFQYSDMLTENAQKITISHL